MSGIGENKERQLVENLKNGDILAFDELFQKYSKKLFYFAQGYLHSKDDAESLVQEVFIKVWEKRKYLKKHLSFNSFLYTITFNAIRKHFRKKAREKKYLDRFLENFDEKQIETEATIEYNNLCEMANKTINKLPPKRKMIYLLSRQDGLTNEEIANRLNISKKTVENQIHLALKFLKEYLSKDILLVILYYCLYIS